MTELKSRGVKMLPSKDNQHKISVRKYHPRILHSPANEGSKKCNMLWADKGAPNISIFSLRKILLFEDVCTKMHEWAVTKMQTTAGRVV